jgi:NAD(P)-dependent dehydrogenase (short-subunit alcohol dehydrogenase family)
MPDNKKFIDLTGKVAIVTGGGSGIGRGIALELARAGADIAVADINASAAEKAAAEVRALGRKALGVQTDVADQASTDTMAAAALRQLRRIDILVNNAGVGGASGWHERVTASREDWDTVFAVNVFGIVHASQSVAPHMMERRSGKIVNIASAAGRQGSLGFAHYSSSKAAAINVSQAWAYRLAPYSINVNTVCPGLLWTELWERLAKRRLAAAGGPAASGRTYFDERVRSIPLAREQTPEDIGKAVAFLASERARNITGQALNVDGGAQMN